MSTFDPLGTRPNDPLEKWRDDAERRQRDFAEARGKREREERRAVKANDVARLRADFEAWKTKQTDVRRQEMTAIAEFVDEIVDKLVDKFEAHSTRIRNAILDACESRFVALEMALKTAQSGAKGFSSRASATTHPAGSSIYRIPCGGSIVEEDRRYFSCQREGALRRPVALG